MAARGANIVAIDEPEMHLHPPAQRTVGRLLAGASPQRIVATHAPNIILQMRPEDLVTFGPDRRARQISEDSPGLTSLSVRWWRTDIIDALTAREILVVEGPSDLILVEAASRALGVHLDRLGVHVLDLGGAAVFGTVFRFFGPEGFGLPVCGLVDADHAQTWAYILDLESNGLSSAGYHVCDLDLESEYVAALGPDVVATLLAGSNLFTANQLAPLSRVGSRSVEGVADFCRKRRYKTLAAASVAATLTREQASAITPLASLIVKVSSDS